jgi:hypothetical protein
MPVARASSVTRTQAQASSTVTEVRARGALLEARPGCQPESRTRARDSVRASADDHH